MKIQDIKPGMKLKVVDSDYSHLRNGAVITVDHIYQNCVYVAGMEEKGNGFYPSRFEKAQKDSKRDGKGRFVSDAQGPIRLTPPAGLKNGSLYAVKRKRGYTVARLKVQFKGGAVVSERGKLFLTKPENIKIATVTEVQEYLKK